MQTDPRLRALNRFGLGARPGELNRIEPQSWLRAQVQTSAVRQPAGNLPSTRTIVEEIAAARQNGKMSQEMRSAMRKQGRERMGEEVLASLNLAITTDAPFVERLVRFWSNHFAISAQGEQMVVYLAGAYEREAIRPHVFGRFEDMVLASAMHPAMLIYLDQTRSIGPKSRAGRKSERGLNENYARELMELHTLGVDGGYTQDDVRQLALMLTGWTVGGIFRGRTGGQPKPFAFMEQLHEPGSKVLLNRRFAQAGVNEGRQAISLLCRQPSTARFIATKLVRHFVADQPHPLDVDYIAGVFQDTGGDLRAVSLALLDLDSAFYGTERKFRSPQEFVIAAARALGLKQSGRSAVQALQSMRHPLWSPPSPAGYGDMVVDWADPDSLLRRADFATLMAKRLRGSIDPGAVLAETMQVANPTALVRLLEQQPNNQTQLALLIASPDFQWR